MVLAFFYVRHQKATGLTWSHRGSTPASLLQGRRSSSASSLGAVFAGFPVLWMLSSSFKANPEIFAATRRG